MGLVFATVAHSWLNCNALAETTTSDQSTLTGLDRGPTQGIYKAHAMITLRLIAERNDSKPQNSHLALQGAAGNLVKSASFLTVISGRCNEFILLYL